MALDEMQRMALSRAQVGDWDLADAMELLARMKGTDVVSGERIGGRLSVLNHSRGAGMGDEITRQTDLNGKTVWRRHSDALRRDGWTLTSTWAHGVLRSFRQSRLARAAIHPQPTSQMETV